MWTRCAARTRATSCGKGGLARPAGSVDGDENDAAATGLRVASQRDHGLQRSLVRVLEVEPHG